MVLSSIVAHAIYFHTVGAPPPLAHLWYGWLRASCFLHRGARGDVSFSRPLVRCHDNGKCWAIPTNSKIYLFLLSQMTRKQKIMPTVSILLRRRRHNYRLRCLAGYRVLLCWACPARKSLRHGPRASSINSPCCAKRGRLMPHTRSRECSSSGTYRHISTNVRL